MTLMISDKRKNLGLGVKKDMLGPISVLLDTGHQLLHLPFSILSLFGWVHVSVFISQRKQPSSRDWLEITAGSSKKWGGKKRRREKSPSSSALIFCSHGTSPTISPQTLCSLTLPSCFAELIFFFSFLSAQKLIWPGSNLIISFSNYFFVFFLYNCVLDFLHLTQLTCLFGATPLSILPSRISPLLISSQALFCVYLGRAVSATCLLIKLKYSWRLSAACNSRWCRLRKDCQFPWQPSSPITLHSSLGSAGKTQGEDDDYPPGNMLHAGGRCWHYRETITRGETEGGKGEKKTHAIHEALGKAEDKEFKTC